MPATRLRIFISSVQSEFAQIRRDLKAFLLGDAMLRHFVSDVFTFEDLPASDRRADDVYLGEVDRSDVYLGIFGARYGSEDADGISPTEREYDRATERNKTRLVYIWGSDDAGRAPKMQRLIRKAEGQIIRRRVEDVSALTAEVYASLVDHLDRAGALRVPPFDASAGDGATLDDLSRRRIDWFLETAGRERGFPLARSTTTESLLTHLSLLDGDRPTNAAVLLFGSAPQRAHRAAQVNCVHCHGTEYRRPFASFQVYGGDLFEQADQARDFVLAKINRTVGTRATSITAPAAYELPPDAVGEAIVNAIAHRDYHSNAAVDVRLFADRLEVWNPGSLPSTLSFELLRRDHPSVPNNPLLAESLYLARYIERVGSGTQMMIDQCREAGLPEPDFELRNGSFVVTLWRDWLTSRSLGGLDLNERQSAVVPLLRQQRRVTNREYQSVTGATRPTAKRDLDDLTRKGVLVLRGSGRGAYYEVPKKWLGNGSNGPLREADGNGS